MATQTVPTWERKLPLSFEPIPSKDSEKLSTRDRAPVEMAANLLRVWTASVETAASLAAVGDGDLEGLSWTLIAIGKLLCAVQDDVPNEFFLAKGTIQSLDLYFSGIAQDCKINEVAPEILAEVGSYAYRLLSGVLSTGELQ